MKIGTFRNKVWLVRNAWLTNSKCYYPMAVTLGCCQASATPGTRAKGPPSAGCKVQREKGISARGAYLPEAKGAARGRPPPGSGTGNTPRGAEGPARTGAHLAALALLALLTEADRRQAGQVEGGAERRHQKDCGN